MKFWIWSLQQTNNNQTKNHYTYKIKFSAVLLPRDKLNIFFLVYINIQGRLIVVLPCGIMYSITGHLHLVPDVGRDDFCPSPFSKMLAMYSSCYVEMHCFCFLPSSGHVRVLSFAIGISCVYWLVMCFLPDSVYVLDILCLLICLCWVILASMEWSWLDHGLWSFNFCLQVFY
jgi:hypothetical protein